MNIENIVEKIIDEHIPILVDLDKKGLHSRYIEHKINMVSKLSSLAKPEQDNGEVIAEGKVIKEPMAYGYFYFVGNKRIDNIFKGHENQNIKITITKGE